MPISIRFVAILVSLIVTIRASGQNPDRPSGFVVDFGWTSFQTGASSKAVGFSPNGRDLVRQRRERFLSLENLTFTKAR